jgi:hypothetical protein
MRAVLRARFSPLMLVVAHTGTARVSSAGPLSLWCINRDDISTIYQVDQNRVEQTQVPHASRASANSP